MKLSFRDLLCVAGILIGRSVGVGANVYTSSDRVKEASGASRVRFLQNTPVVGMIVDDTSSARDSGSMTVVDDLIEKLEDGDDQVTVISSVQLAGLLCESLVYAEDADTLAFEIGPDETIIADKSSYTKVNETVFSDGILRNIWVGVQVDPEQAEDEAEPAIVTMTWGEECDVETFLFKLTSHKTDGTTTNIKSVPCDTGSETRVCLVELSLDLLEEGEPGIPEDVVEEGNSTANATASFETSFDDSSRRRLRASGLPGLNEKTLLRAGKRGLQETTENTVIDVMYLYTPEALVQLGGVTDAQMETTIIAALMTTNEAFVNSDISLQLNLVHVAELPFPQPEGTLLSLQAMRFDSDVAAQRETYSADLVQMVGGFSDFCGRGYYFSNSDPTLGFSVVGPNCIDGLSHTHEFGHNMGCRHNREDTTSLTDYSHGYRYCDGTSDEAYRTIMSYSCGTLATRVNYFSNPDVDYLGKPTGTATENNARTIRDNMEVIAAFYGAASPVPTPAPSPAPTPAPTAPPASGNGYTELGCYGDDSSDRVLTGAVYYNEPDLTTERCAELCDGFSFFGTEYGRECFCGLTDDDPMELGAATCNFACIGDDTETCGGRNAINTYEYVETVEPYTYAGCFGDSSGDRVLTGEFTKRDPTMTAEVCREFCGDAPFFGTEYGNECFCGVDSDDYERLGNAVCDRECEGDSSEVCGGRNALSIYVVGDPVVEMPTYLGCFADQRNDRVMTLGFKDLDTPMTNELCEATCEGFAYFATQYSKECWCGDASTDYDEFGSSTECNMPCEGDAEQTCGGVNAMSTYEY